MQVRIRTGLRREITRTGPSREAVRVREDLSRGEFRARREGLAREIRARGGHREVSRVREARARGEPREALRPREIRVRGGHREALRAEPREAPKVREIRDREDLREAFRAREARGGHREVPRARAGVPGHREHPPYWIPSRLPRNPESGRTETETIRTMEEANSINLRRMPPDVRTKIVRTRRITAGNQERIM